MTAAPLSCTAGDGTPDPPRRCADVTGLWWERAACRGMPSRLWDLSIDDGPGGRKGERQTAVRHAQALAVCSRCPVTTECLADALRHDDEGVRGGRVLHKGTSCPLGYPAEVVTRGAERHRIRGQMPCPTCAESKRHYQAGRKDEARGGRKPTHRDGETTHGTLSGAKWHQRRREQACGPCRSARSVADRARVRA